MDVIESGVIKDKVMDLLSQVNTLRDETIYMHENEDEYDEDTLWGYTSAAKEMACDILLLLRKWERGYENTFNNGGS